jgi:hypothetical protein
MRKLDHTAQMRTGEVGVMVSPAPAAEARLS